MRLFISYAHDDMLICRQFVRLLDAHEVWFDQNLRGGEEWWKRILDRLDWCEGLIYLLSPSSVKSDYCLREAQIALDNDKVILPIKIRRRTEIPDFISHIQHIDLSDDLESIENVLKLMNTLFDAERKIFTRKITSHKLNLSATETVPPNITNSPTTNVIRNLPYNYTYRLDQKGFSASTKYVYTRWICDYLERIANFEPISSKDRETTLSKLSIDVIEQSLSVAQVNAWLGMLKLEGMSKLSVAKAALLAFVETLADDNVIDKELVMKIRAIEAYKLDFEKRPRRILSYEQVVSLVLALNTSSILAIRNSAVVSLLMVLRVSELADLKWKGVSIFGNQVSITNPQNNNTVQLPGFAQKNLKVWYEILSEHETNKALENTFVIRRFIHGDHIQDEGVSTHALRKVLTATAKSAKLGKITPEDLRISFRALAERKGIESF